MIYNFRSRDAEAIWHGDASGAMSPAVQQVTRRKLRMLNCARQLEDLRAIDEADGTHSLRVDAASRILFRWHKRGGAKDVDLAR